MDTRTIAIRFADLWALDPHRMVDEIYAGDIEMENMCNTSLTINGSAQLHEIEDMLIERIPEHRHELVRVVADGAEACLETMVVAPVTHEFTPVCLWWWLDDDGKVAAESGWFDWNARRTDSTAAHGTMPPLRSGTTRSADWYAHAAQQYADAWTRDPTGAALDRFAPGCVAGVVGRDETHGHDALRRARRAEFEAGPGEGREMRVDRVVGEGDVLAMMVTICDPVASTRGFVVLAFDGDELIESERRYYDWSKAQPVGAANRFGIGQPGWTLRGR